MPKRRIYDITNVLEGSGLTEKKSKNVITFTKSSDEPGAVEQLQTEIGNLVEEEAILDVWISRLTKQLEARRNRGSMNVSSHDVIKALYYPQDGSTPICHHGESNADESSLPTTVAIHAPLGSFVSARQGDNDFERCYRLHVATEADIEESSTGNEIRMGKRRVSTQKNGKFVPSKQQRTDELDDIRVHCLKAKLNKQLNKVISYGVETMERSNMIQVVNKLPHAVVAYNEDENDYDVLGQDEGVSDFFA